ncbi:MAG: hypothetical protein PUC29_02090, partial [Clostridia bacterium]|nr:hypothetical protein [Clostridia bacterium]
RGYCTRDNQNYTVLQPESFIPDVIETVLHDKELKQIYVCYNDANCVNVYSEDGEFLWAVATPYIRNSYFELQDGKLIIYGDGAYIYNSKNGEFLEKTSEDNLELSYRWSEETADEMTEGEIYFDSYQVYKYEPDGSLRTVVSRPRWHLFFNFGACLFIAGMGAVGLGITFFFEKKKSYNRVKNTEIKSPKARKIIHYFKATSIVHIIYTVLDIIFGFFGGYLCIGIMPLALNFIFSGVIICNMLDRISFSEEEAAVVQYYKTVEFATFVIAFFSVVAAVRIATAL